jgi:hypothetical protein
MLSVVNWQITTEKWGRNYHVIDFTGKKESISIEAYPPNTGLSASRDAFVSSALKGQEEGGAGGHNAVDSSGHSAAASSITTTSSIGAVIKHDSRNAIVSTIFLAT